jgi:superkiller protein 3
MASEPKSPFWKANNLTNTGRMLLDDGSYDKAVACFDEALKHTSVAWHLKGVALFEMERFDDAIKCHEVAAQLDPENESVQMGRGLALHGAKKYAEALVVYDAILKKDPECPQAWFNKACAYSMMKRDDEAIDCVRKAHKIDAENTGIHLAVDEAFERLRKTVKFERLLAEFRDKEPAKVKAAWCGAEYIR